MTPSWLRNAMVQTCEVWDRVDTGETDEYGNPVYEDVMTIVCRCLLQPASQAEIQLGRAGVGTFTLFLPNEVAAAVNPFCRYVVDATQYEAEGPPALYSQLYDPGVHHIEVGVTRSSA